MHKFVRTLCLILMVFGLLGGALQAAHAQPDKKKKQNPVLAPVEGESALPRVLIIGDSISMGYTRETRALLKGVANVHRPPTNCGPTTKGLDQLDAWLGEGQWDVIHFNWGLHDLKYMNERGEPVDAEVDERQVSIEQYEKNMDELVERLKKTNAKLIWRNTTPVPEGAKRRVPGDAVRYNQVAALVMVKHGVPTHDLYSFAKLHEEEIQRKKDVHYTKAGSERLAEQVAQVIRVALEAGPAKDHSAKVLLIGDSISGGYTKPVIELMRGKADVSRIPGNGRWTGHGVEMIDAWLGETDWDVIHFNWGLWDMYGWRYKDEDRSPQAYEARLEKLVARLKQTDAKLIWATTTPACPGPESTMLKQFKTEVVISPELEQRYLDAAERVMKKHGVQINDLHALVLPKLDTLSPAPDNVHFTGKGSRLMAEQVTQAIRAALKK